MMTLPSFQSNRSSSSLRNVGNRGIPGMVLGIMIISVIFCSTQFRGMIKVEYSIEFASSFVSTDVPPATTFSTSGSNSFSSWVPSFWTGADVELPSIKPFLASKQRVMVDIDPKEAELFLFRTNDFKLIPFAKEPNPPFIAVPSRTISFKRVKYDELLDDPSPSPGEGRDYHQMRKYAPNQQYERDEEHNQKWLKECVPMKSWQTKSFPTCNSVHETHMISTLKILGGGGWRYTAAHLETDELVVKFLDLDDDYDYDMRTFEIHRVDALVSERLTSSPYIMDIYGYCGMSAFYEKGTVELEDAITPDRGLTFAMKFNLAYQVSQALSALHSFDYPAGNNSTVAHRDIKTSNIMLSKKGIAKLNDFNDSMIRYWNVTSNKKCPYYNNGFPLWWGMGFKPVEMAANNYTPLEDSLDVFGLGGLMYNILVGKLPYYQFKQQGKKQVRFIEELNKGTLPPFPAPYNASSIEALTNTFKIRRYRELVGSNLTHTVNGIVTMMRLINETMVFNPKDRPSATYVREQLKPFADESKGLDISNF